MTAQDQRAAFCRKCARVAPSTRPSLDPRYPLVLCRWRDRAGKEHGHGVTVGTYDQAEAQALVADAQQRRRLANHKAGRHDPKKPVRSCLACQEAAGHVRHRALHMFVASCAECLANQARTGSASSEWAPAPR